MMPNHIENKVCHLIELIVFLSCLDRIDCFLSCL